MTKTNKAKLQRMNDQDCCDYFTNELMSKEGEVLEGWVTIFGTGLLKLFKRTNSL